MIDEKTQILMAAWRIGSDVIQQGGYITPEEIRDFFKNIRVQNGQTLKV
jgi:hypothetical protein